MVRQIDPRDVRGNSFGSTENTGCHTEIQGNSLRKIDPRGVKNSSFVITEIANQLSETEPGDIQKIAANQTRLLDYYYNAALNQATVSFRWALIAACTGLFFFLGAIVLLFFTNSSGVATVSVIGGTIVEVISGINFFIYGKTTTQLDDFHRRLDQTQRFLLANSICESLQENFKQKSRANLVSLIATLGVNREESSNKNARTRSRRRDDTVDTIDGVNHGKQR